MQSKNRKPGVVVPRQKRSVQSRESIFKAAEKVFARKGLHGARVDEIARLANVNKQRIYAYFGSKRELYREVLLGVYSKAATNRKLMDLSERDIPGMTDTIIAAFFEFHEKNPRFWRMLAWENLMGGGGLKPTDWRQIRGAYIRHLERLYKTGQDRGIFRRGIGFGTYLLLLFAATSFYFSNQLTISHLLSLKLRSPKTRHRIQAELAAAVTAGVHACTTPPERA